MTDALTIDPAEAKARTLLEAAGVRGITIAGAGESWTVAIGWNEPERFVVAYSAKNPATPNDPVYLASQALATLIRNEGPCPHVSQATCDEVSQLELGAESLADAGDEEQDSGDEASQQSISEISPQSGLGATVAIDRSEQDTPSVEQGREGGMGEAGDEGGADAPEAPPLQAHLEPDPEPEAFAGTTILGADPLDRIRSQRIGDVARIAAGKIAERRAAASYTLAEYQELQGYVMSHTDAVGAFQGDAERYARFVALADCQRAVNDLGAFRDEVTAHLLDADRAGIEAFEIAALGWPS